MCSSAGFGQRMARFSLGSALLNPGQTILGLTSAWYGDYSGNVVPFNSGGGGLEWSSEHIEIDQVESSYRQLYGGEDPYSVPIFSLTSNSPLSYDIIYIDGTLTHELYVSSYITGKAYLNGYINADVKYLRNNATSLYDYLSGFNNKSFHYTAYSAEAYPNFSIQTNTVYTASFHVSGYAEVMFNGNNVYNYHAEIKTAIYVSSAQIKRGLHFTGTVYTAAVPLPN